MASAVRRGAIGCVAFMAIVCVREPVGAAREGATLAPSRAVQRCLDKPRPADRGACLRSADESGVLELVWLAGISSKGDRLADEYVREAASKAFQAEREGRAQAAAALERGPDDAADERRRALALRALRYLTNSRGHAPPPASRARQASVASPATPAPKIEPPRACSKYASDPSVDVSVEALECIRETDVGWPVSALVDAAIGPPSAATQRAGRLLGRLRALDEGQARRLATRLLTSRDRDQQIDLCQTLEHTTPASAAWVAYAALSMPSPTGAAVPHVCERLRDRPVVEGTPGPAYGICQTIRYSLNLYRRLCVEDAAVGLRGRITIVESPFGTRPRGQDLTITPPRLIGEHIDVSGVRYFDLSDVKRPEGMPLDGLLVVPLVLGPFEAPVARRLVAFTLAGSSSKVAWQSPPCRTPSCREDLVVRRDLAQRTLLGFAFLGWQRPVLLSLDELMPGTLVERLGCDPLLGTLEGCRGDRGAP